MIVPSKKPMPAESPMMAHAHNPVPLPAAATQPLPVCEADYIDLPGLAFSPEPDLKDSPDIPDAHIGQ